MDETQKMQETQKMIGGLDKDLNLIFSAAEAQWILTVLDDASNKLSLSSYLTQDILKDRIMDAIDHETVVAMKEHFDVEKQYFDMLQQHKQRIEANGGADVPMDEETFEQFNSLELCLSDSTRTVVRLLKMNPVLARKLRDVCLKRDAAALEFINIFARLRKLIHEKLKMTAEEERDMKEQLASLKAEQAEDTSRFNELTEGLALLRSEHKQTLESKDRKIMRLRKQIENLKIKTQQETEAFEKKMEEEAQLALQMHEASKEELVKKLEEMKDKLKKDGDRNYAKEMKEHRKKFHSAEAVEKLIEKYDNQMKSKHFKLTQLKDMYKEESEELKVLTEYFTDVDAENKRQEEELAALTKRRDEELKVLRTQHQAAVLFQKMFRGFHAKAIAGGKKKKASKKDGKKKK